MLFPFLHTQPHNQDKFLVCENLLGNKPICYSDSESPPGLLKRIAPSEGQILELANWLSGEIGSTFANITTECTVLYWPQLAHPYTSAAFCCLLLPLIHQQPSPCLLVMLAMPCWESFSHIFAGFSAWDAELYCAYRRWQVGKTALFLSFTWPHPIKINLKVIPKYVA